MPLHRGNMFEVLFIFYSTISIPCNGSILIKCGAGNVALIATPGSAPQGILRDGVSSVNRRRPLKSRWAEQ